jgi:hypothetical protein
LYGPHPGGKLGEVRRVIALCLCLLGACFDPNLAFENGALTCTHSCPPAFDCIQGHCFRQGTGPDDAPELVTDAAVDVPVVIDAPVDVPVVPDAACSEGALRCAAPPAPAREVCRSGQWVAETACTDPTPFCIDQGTCGPCTVGQLRCVASNIIEACVMSGSTTIWQTQESCDEHNFCDAFQGTQTQPTCCREPCWQFDGSSWVRHSCRNHANNCGVSQNCGTCSGTQNFCCQDIPNRCTTQAGCQL